MSKPTKDNGVGQLYENLQKLRTFRGSWASCERPSTDVIEVLPARRGSSTWPDSTEATLHFAFGHNGDEWCLRRGRLHHFHAAVGQGETVNRGRI
ncbi:hypothetical protein NL676_008537 [Syzygium grande]|nr:hypothetical protein NL676_008536 [Syzygium grande]KAI6705575.1 hypothetical protein NL676_008537 [Syzygium grande]